MKEHDAKLSVKNNEVASESDKEKRKERANSMSSSHGTHSAEGYDDEHWVKHHYQSSYGSCQRDMGATDLNHAA